MRANSSLGTVFQDYARAGLDGFNAFPGVKKTVSDGVNILDITIFSY